MKVILLQDIYKHGVAGEVVDVKAGFARNYLIPRGMAKQASNKNLQEHQELMEQVELRRAKYENMLNELARQIDGTELIFERRASPTGTLYGSVTTQEIADALMEATTVDINRRRISQQALRELGEFDVPVRLGSEISPVLHVIIVRDKEEFLEEREARRRAEEEAEQAAEGEGDVVAEAAVEDVVDEIEAPAEEVVEAEAAVDNVTEAADTDETSEE